MHLTKNCKGFTLLEIIVAMAIIAIISAPLLQTFLTSTRVGQHSYDWDKANTISVETVETIKGNPSQIISSDFSYTESNVTGQVNHHFTRTQYYDSAWNGPTSDANSPFRVLTTLSGKDATGTGLDSLSYFPQLIFQSSSKQNYHIEANYTFMTSGTYTLTLVSDDSEYTLSTTSAILRNTLTGGSNALSIRIPTADCVSGILPVVVDIGTNPSKQVTLQVNNQTNSELGFYVYGDIANDPHFITVLPTSGVVNINYMKPLPTELKFDKLAVNVKVFQQKDSTLLTDYTTMIYMPE